jgi:hypothetical protein
MPTPDMVKVNNKTETSPNSYRYHLAQSVLICDYRSLYSCDECVYSYTCTNTHTYIHIYAQQLKTVQMNVYFWPQQLKKLSVCWLENSHFTKGHVLNHNLTHPVMLPVDEFNFNYTRFSASHNNSGDTAKVL